MKNNGSEDKTRDTQWTYLRASLKQRLLDFLVLIFHGSCYTRESFFYQTKHHPPQNPYPLYWMVSIPLQLLLAFPASPLTQKCNSHNLPFSKNGFIKTITYHLFSHISFFHHTQPIILIFSVFLLSKMAHPWPYFFLNLFFLFLFFLFLAPYEYSWCPPMVFAKNSDNVSNNGQPKGVQ